jgi:hypothetical protein
MRATASAVRMRASRTDAVSRSVGGLDIALAYSDAADPSAVDHPAAAAYAAWLGVQTLDEATAASLAEDEGIVTHLTSIVLVDQEGETVDGVAVNRKIALSKSLESFGDAAAGGSIAFASMSLMASPSPMRGMKSLHSASMSDLVGASGSRSRGLFASGADAAAPGSKGLGAAAAPDNAFFGLFLEQQSYIDNSVELPITGAMVPGAVDWNAAAEEFNAGQLPNALIPLAMALVGRQPLKALADSLGEPEWKVAVAIIALKIGKDDRIAQRLARKILAALIGGDLVKAALAELPA